MLHTARQPEPLRSQWNSRHLQQASMQTSASTLGSRAQGHCPLKVSGAARQALSAAWRTMGLLW